MEDVVLHYQPGSAAELGPLLETTEKVLQAFPFQPPPVFNPWFPAAADHHRPIRPAKSPPIITASESRQLIHTAQIDLQKAGCDGHGPERAHECPRADRTRTLHENPEISNDGICVTETSRCLLSASPFNKDREIVKSPPAKHKDVLLSKDSPLKRSWSVFTQKRVLQRSRSFSQHFHHMVSIHRLHLRQRVKWVISHYNCGPTRDIEQVWQAVSRSVQSFRLPTCNANIQRERAEIWVFCDLFHSEQVGHLLKDELQLSGTISLFVRRLGNIFSM